MLEALAYFGLSLATYRLTDCRSRLSSRVEALAVVQVWAFGCLCHMHIVARHTHA